jgi:ferredoxin
VIFIIFSIKKVYFFGIIYLLKGGNMKVSIDKDACIGCGLCVNDQPDLFVMEGDKAVPKSSEVPKGKEDACKTAASNCPTQAIKCE